MKNLLIANFTALVLGVTATPVVAAETTPIDLVYLGYQGYFTEAGIPGQGAFLQAVYLGKIDAKTLVNGAIAQGKLPSETINDQSYLRKVKASLFKLRQGR